MELPSNISEQIAFNTRHKIGEQMLFVRDKATHEEHLSQFYKLIMINLK